MRLVNVILAMLVTTNVLAMNAARASDSGYQVLTHESRDRFYQLHLPDHVVTDGHKWPLVIVLHGGGGNAENAESMTGFTDLAKREQFAVVYPEGSGKLKHKLLTWNAGPCCGYAMENTIDDVGFISRLIEQLILTKNIDPKRVFVTGISNGGMMSHRLGIELSEKITAIAPVVATIFGDEKTPSTSVSALMINGALDQSVPPLGGKPGGRFAKAWDATAVKPTLAQAEFWASNNQCQSTPSKTETSKMQHVQYECPGALSVQHYLILDNGHAWPGGKKGSRLGDDPSNAINATETIWSFFKSKSK